MKKLFTALAFCVSAFAMEKACADGWHDGYHYDGFHNDGYHDVSYVGGHDGGFLSRSSVELRAGYRTDDLNFRIGSPTEVPDTLSKVHFDSLRIWQIGATLRSSFCDCLYFRGDVNFGKIYSGKSRVTNFNCFCDDSHGKRDHRFKRRVGRGDVWDVSAAIGYQICACDNALRFIPLLGYAAAEQRVRRFGPIHGFAARRDLSASDFCDRSRHHGSWDESGSNVAAQPTSLAKSGSNNWRNDDSSDCCFGRDFCPSSRFRARWTGPWLGFDAAYNLNCNLDLYGGFEYHWAHFSGKGHWNFDNRFVDNFSQGANGDGQIYTFGLNWHQWDCWDFGVEVKFQQWCTRRGHDRSYFNSDNSSHCDRPKITYNRLNYVKWDSFAISFATAYLF